MVLARTFGVVLFCFSNGSVKAEVRVLATMNTNTTGKDEAINHLIDGLDSSLGKDINVTALKVLGKQDEFGSDALKAFSVARQVAP